jgi:hypothetical protein
MIWWMAIQWVLKSLKSNSGSGPDDSSKGDDKDAGNGAGSGAGSGAAGGAAGGVADGAGARQSAKSSNGGRSHGKYGKSSKGRRRANYMAFAFSWSLAMIAILVMLAVICPTNIDANCGIKSIDVGASF